MPKKVKKNGHSVRWGGVHGRCPGLVPGLTKETPLVSFRVEMTVPKHQNENNKDIQHIQLFHDLICLCLYVNVTS